MGFVQYLARQRLRLEMARQVHLTLGGTAEKAAEQYGDRLFLQFEKERYSFAEFNAQANRWANFFHAEGIGKGDHVALMMENRPEFLTALTGLSKLGAIVPAINTNQRDTALIHSLNLSNTDKVIVGAECLEAVKSVLPKLERISAKGVYHHSRWPEESKKVTPPKGSHNLNEKLAEASDENPPNAGLNGRDLLMYIFTSGTTGLPKAAYISHMRWIRVGTGMKQTMSLKKSDVLYCCLPLYHSNAALIGFGGALVNGCGFALSRKLSTQQFWKDCVQYGVTVFIYIGEVLRYLLNSPPTPLDQAHQVNRIFGNGLRADIWPVFQKRFGIPHIREFYASTEGNLSTVNMDNRVGSVGRPSKFRPNNMALVQYNQETETHPKNADGYLIRCKPGEAGELLGRITPLSPFSGYTSKEETAKKILTNVFEPGDQYFRTGDLLSQDAKGYYYFVDRIGDTFRWKGENVSTEEVQKVLSGFGGIHMVNIYGVTIPGADGRAGMAAITMDEKTGNFDPQAFYDFADQHLAEYAKPAFVRICEAMETTTTYKMRKPELQKDGFDPKNITDTLYFRDETNKCYSPLDKGTYQQITQGKVRL